MNILSEQEYLAVNLFYLSKKSIKDIALITNQSTVNIKVILHRTRKKCLHIYAKQYKYDGQQDRL